jgi:hypothetical protein
MYQPQGTAVRRRVAVAAVVGSAIVWVAGPQSAGAAEAPPAGEWRLDESDGQRVVDSGRNGLHGHLGASSSPDAADPARMPGVSGGALHFDGNTYVRLPDRPELDVQTLTTEAVVRAPSSPGAWRYVLSRGGQGCFAGSYGLYTAAAGGMAVYVFDGTRYVVSATARPSDVWDGQWHHVAGTFDGRVVRLFLDGRQVGDVIDTPMRIDYASTSIGAYLGRFVGDCSLAFSGDVDLVRLWPEAQSQAAVAAAAARELRNGALPTGPLPSADPPRFIAGSPPGTGSSGEPGGSGSAGSPPPAGRARRCVLRLHDKRLTPRRRTVVKVRVKVRGRPARRARVVAKRAGRAAVLAAGRTRGTGWARLVFDARRVRRVRISAPKKSGCAPVYARVASG